jgi:hypothetical protein
VLYTTPCTLYLGEIPRLLCRMGWGSGHCLPSMLGYRRSMPVVFLRSAAPLKMRIRIFHVILTLMETGRGGADRKFRCPCMTTVIVLFHGRMRTVTTQMHMVGKCTIPKRCNYFNSKPGRSPYYVPSYTLGYRKITPAIEREETDSWRMCKSMF